MSILLVQARFQPTGGAAEDVAVNTWHFASTSTPATPTELDAILDALHAFYSELDGFLPTSLWTGDVEYRVYDRADSEPRVPVTVETRTLTGLASTAALPPECTVVLSYHSTYVSGTNKARRRGRVFLPTMVQAIVDTDGELASWFTAALATAAENLLTASGSSGDFGWNQYSPTAGASLPVTGGWVDNSVDVQRRRSREATARVVWP